MDEYNEDRGMKRERSWFQDGPNSKMPRPMPSTLRVLLRSIDAGGIIGKGGENIKRLRKKYECQVQLPDSSGNPERVLTVVGELNGCVGVFAECLEKVKAEIRKRDGHAPIEVQILIPQPFMGTIIGTGGTKIKDLRKSTNANIKIFSEPMPYSNERSISLSGTEGQIIECVNFFLQEIGTKEPKEPIMLYDPSVADMPPYGYDGPGGGPPPFRGGRGGGGRGRGGRGGHPGGRGGGRGGMSGRPPQFSGPPGPGRDNSFQPPPTNNMPPPPQGPNQPPPPGAPQAPPVQYPQPGSQVPNPPPSSFPSQPPPPVQNSAPNNSMSGSGNQQQPPPQFTGYPPPTNSNYPPPPPVPGQGPPPVRAPGVVQQQPPQAPPPHSAANQMPQGGAPYSQPPPPVVPPSSFNAPAPQQPPSSFPASYAPPQTGYVPPPKTSFDSGQASYAPSQSSYSTTQTTSYTTPATSYASPGQPSYAAGQQNFPPKPPPQPPMGAFPTGQPSNPPSSGYSMGYGPPYQQPPPPQPTFPAAAAAGYNSQPQQAPPTQPPATAEVQQTKQVTIPNEYSSAIVGPGGANLQQIKTQSGCNITMDDNVSAAQRIITIVGSARNIALAEQYMKDSVRQHHQV